MSGLKLKSGGRPHDENDEMRFAVGLGSLATWFVQVIVTAPPARRLSMITPLTAVIATTGTVIAGVPRDRRTEEPGRVVVDDDAGRAGRSAR